ncbi:MAG: FecR domain-containing protein [Myxococcota bacterium]|nr:FecR domain-containing protein [Myxococcota bacterium]
MKKRVLIYGVMVAALTAVGIAVSIAIFGESADEILHTERPETAPAIEDQMASPKDGQQAENDVDSNAVRVISITGQAERVANEQVRTSALSVGESLTTDDRVKTGDNSRLMLRFGEKSKIELAERGELSVGSVSPDDRRFKLYQGRITVELEKSDQSLRVENSDGSVVAQSEEGIFTVLNTGTTVAVATRTGSVDLSSGGETVAVTSGQQSVAARGIPSKPAPIPADVMLRVVDPGCRVQRERHVVLRGRTTPGSALSANGTPVELREDGRFSVRVPLKIGKNNIAVVTEDPAGRRAQKTFPCITVDPSAPIREINIKWGPTG